ncbi:MAG: PAS domain S-box protein [Chloroflexi bacterium]|nr:PAS domain S-box protein [Chloroflexota bacterium]
MTKTNSSKIELRAQAEAKLSKRKKSPVTETDSKRLIHELEVHQIELEMQNEELMQGRAEAEAVHRQYTDLYDFAPVGYFTLTRDGTIRMSNLTGANLLGAESNKLVKRRFGVFVSVESRPAFSGFLEKIFSSAGNEFCEIMLLKDGTNPLWVRLDGVCAENGQECRIVMKDITERKQIEEDLRESEERYHSLFNIIDEGMAINEIVTDENGDVVDYIILSVNPAFEKHTIYKTEEVLGKRATDVYQMSPEYIREWWKEHSKIDVSAHTEMYHEPSRRWFHVNTTRPKGKRFATIFIDVTERKRLETQLQENYTVLRGIINSNPMPIFSLDREYRYTSFNETHVGVMKSLYGVEIELGHSMFEYQTVEADRVKSKPNLDRALAGEYFRDEAFSGADSRGLRYFEVIHNPIRNASGEVTGVAVFAFDITERKQSMEALGESNNFNLELLQTIPFGMDIVDEDGKVLFISPMMKKDVGQNALGMRCWELYKDDKQQCANCPLNQSLKIGVTHTLESFGVLGGRVFEISHTRITFEGKQAILEVFYDITERKRAEQALLMAEADYRGIFEKAPVGIFQSTGNGRFKKVNQTMAELYGYQSPEEMVEEVKSIAKQIYVDESSRNEFKSLLAKHGEIQGFTAKNRRRDGSVLWTSTNARVIKTETTQDVIYEGFISDITERKKAEAEREQYFKFFQSSVDMMVIADPNGAFLQVNPATTQVLGYSEAELLSKPFIDFIYPDDKSATINEMERQQKIGNSLNFENRYVCKDGSIIWLSWRAIYVESEGLTYATARDITERKQAQEKLRESEEKFRTIVEQTSAIVYIVEKGREARVRYISPQVEKVLGFTPEEWINQPGLWERLLHYEDRERVMAEGDQSDLTGEPFKSEYRIHTKDGRVIWLYDESKNMMDERGQIKYSQGSEIEITERKQAEEEIRKLNADLEKRVEERTVELVRANHVKDEFLAMMSHELRTPLTSILGFSETLLEGVRGLMTERQQNAVQLIQSSGKHLLNMINDILDISKIESDKFELRPENINVHEVCKASLVFVKQLAEQKAITVEYSSPAFSHIVFADPQRLKQILINLLNNAVKFTPQNGRIKLDAQADAGAGLMRFSVTDTGIGIDPNDLQKLFKPFVQLDSKLSRQYEGTGLGLVLVKKLVEMHGGNIEVHSEVGVGSCFAFVLPWNPRVEIEERLHGTGFDNEQIKTKSSLRAKVLIADDDKSTVMLIEDYLGAFGYQVSVAEDGMQVLPKVEEELPDIILMDIQMPYANGLDLTRRLRSDPRFASVPIIALTAFAMRGDEEKCLEAGMNEYLSKPVRLKELRNLIEKLLGNSDD